jgi:hypothetical protein
MNKSELVAVVKTYLNRPNMPTADVSLLIGIIEGEFNKELREHPRNVKRGSLPMPDDTGILPLPDDVAGILRVFDDGGLYEQYPVSITLDNDRRGYHNRGSVLEVFPRPEAGHTVRLDYHAYLDPLDGDGDTNWLSRFHGDIYLYGVLKEAAVYVKDDARLALWRREFDRRLAELKRQGWNQNIAASPRVRVK